MDIFMLAAELGLNVSSYNIADEPVIKLPNGKGFITQDMVTGHFQYNCVLQMTWDDISVEEAKVLAMTPKYFKTKIIDI